MTQEKNNVVGIGHNSNDNKITETLLELSKALDEVWSVLSKTYSKHNGAMGDTYNFSPFNDEYDTRIGNKFERNQLHFEAQQEQSKCLQRIFELQRKVEGVINEKK